jgi:hypothetical protein
MRIRTIPGRFKGRINDGDMYFLNDPYTAALAEMVCKQCGSLLDSEVTMLGAPPLFDGVTIEEVS